MNIINLSSFTFIDPFYWTVIAVRRIIQEQDIKVILDPSSPSYDYFHCIFGKIFSSSTVPLRLIQYRGEVGKFTTELVKMLSLNYEDVEDEELFKYIISELLNNAIDHGNSSAIACAQKFPNLQEVEIIVGDAGVGIYHTISRKYKTHSTLEAIKKAVEKGVTGAMDYVYGGAKRNAGMGLYIISRIVKDAKGQLYIISKDTIYYCDSESEDYKILDQNSQWDGTVVAVRFNLNLLQKEILDLGFYNYLRMITAEDLDEDLNEDFV